ncbi:MAG: hypothetical protein F6K13_24210 [Okeania sp. SIO2B9]|nr:hypothetical protein [Okeania sp. SIO2B9]
MRINHQYYEINFNDCQHFYLEQVVVSSLDSFSEAEIAIIQQQKNHQEN